MLGEPTSQGPEANPPQVEAHRAPVPPTDRHDRGRVVGAGEVSTQSDILLRIGRNSPVAGTASAIVHSVRDGIRNRRTVALRCIGAASLNQAIKALTVASGQIQTSMGLSVKFTSHFTELSAAEFSAPESDPGGTRTAIVLTIHASRSGS